MTRTKGFETPARIVFITATLLTALAGVLSGFSSRFDGSASPGIRCDFLDRFPTLSPCRVTPSRGSAYNRLLSTVETLKEFAKRRSDADSDGKKMKQPPSDGCSSFLENSTSAGTSETPRTGLRSPLRLLMAAECEHGIVSKASSTKAEKILAYHPAAAPAWGDRIIARDRETTFHWAFSFASFPWLIGGGGLLFAVRRRGRVEASDSEDRPPGSRGFFSDGKNLLRLWPAFLCAALVAFCTGAGWAYVLNPYEGIAADALSFLRSHPMYPVPIESILIWESPQSFHLAAGFLGWYTGFVLSTLMRLWKRDVLGVRLFPFLVQKFVIVMSAAVALSVFDSDYTAAAVFAVGSFPRAGWTLLREAGIQKFRKADDGLQEISALSGVSWWQLARLDDEGIDSASELVRRTRDELDYLEQTLPDDMVESLKRWRREAVLIEGLGLKVFQKIRPFYDDPHRLRSDLEAGLAPLSLFSSVGLDAAEWKKLALELGHNLDRQIEDARLLSAKGARPGTKPGNPENDNDRSAQQERSVTPAA